MNNRILYDDDGDVPNEDFDHTGFGLGDARFDCAVPAHEDEEWRETKSTGDYTANSRLADRAGEYDDDLDGDVELAEVRLVSVRNRFDGAVAQEIIAQIETCKAGRETVRWASAIVKAERLARDQSAEALSARRKRRKRRK